MYFLFNDTPTTEIYTYLHTLSLHDALPIFVLIDTLQKKGVSSVYPHGSIVGQFPNLPGNSGCDEDRSEEHTSELQSLMRISYAVFCLKKKKQITHNTYNHHQVCIIPYTTKNTKTNI